MEFAAIEPRASFLSRHIVWKEQYAKSSKYIQKKICSLEMLLDHTCESFHLVREDPPIALCYLFSHGEGLRVQIFFFSSSSLMMRPCSKIHHNIFPG